MKILLIIYILLYFRFWGTCEEHTGLLHRYIHANVVCCLHPHHVYLALLPMLSLPTLPSVYAVYPPLSLPNLNCPQCVLFLSLSLHVLIVQYLPMSENMQCLIYCSCVSLLRMMVSMFIHVPAKHTNSSFFYACMVFRGVYVPYFPCLVYHRWAFWLVPGLCFCTEGCSEHTCACVFIIKQYSPLGIYPVMGLVGQMEFLFLGP